MNYSCIKNYYEFNIDPISCNSIVYKDLSIWMEEDYYVVPNQYDIYITPPGGNPVKITLDPTSINELSSEKLFSNACFIDGVYCFSTTSCGNSYTRNIAILCNAECKLANLIREASKSQSEDLWNKVIKLKASLDAVYSHAKLNNFELANDEYKILKKDLNNLNCNC